MRNDLNKNTYLVIWFFQINENSLRQQKDLTTDHFALRKFGKLQFTKLTHEYQA